MYAFSVFLAILEMIWLFWSALICSFVLFGRGNKHNTSSLGTSLQVQTQPYTQIIHIYVYMYGKSHYLVLVHVYFYYNHTILGYMT